VLEIEPVIHSSQNSIVTKNVSSKVLIIFCFCLPKEIVKEVKKREKASGIIPDRDIDLYMKVIFQSPFINFQHYYICLYQKNAVIFVEETILVQHS
jgi:hypothetical protein